MATGPDILIVDDDRDLVNSMRVILESAGYQVRTAANGREAQGRISEKTPHLIILDVMMTTDTEGFDLAYKLSRDPSLADIPILMVSGFSQVMAQQGPESFQHILGEQWPVSEFLEKPVDPEKLLTVVKNLLASR